ncbi:DNA alkylation repair enzyme [Jeotgalicoccus saudimassiliensis]|uniref:DNA alkylation repair enzyme n=1 Tax=Jeotgalicoccus saudimassiliensis TaxID=1461582 RepID=A0A078M2I1_9STAP|nr:DNA alkylation repair protein [Jeotgalicoccus saudimassiliensis]CEA01588.1 DNA alkylation repair enzyme [Jeotgalicoccus saudimassiliensis]
MNRKKLRKDYFDKELAKRYASDISEVYPDFDSESFIDDAAIEIEGRRMSERIAVFAGKLKQYLPDDYVEATAILTAVLGQENEQFYFPFEKTHYYRAIAKFIEVYGREDFEQSMKAIEEVTKRDTAEFAIRPFIENDYDKVEKVFKRWGQSDNAHLRRLVTEGTRPRLPWAKKLDFLRNDVCENFRLLQPFLNDPSRYVEKSVANHLNDISKYYPEEVVSFLNENINETSLFIVKRALRTLKKQEHSDALELLETLK